MRDDYQIPNLGQAPASYETSYFNRLVRNIEMTFKVAASVGRGSVKMLNLSPTKVSDLPSGKMGDVAMTIDGRKNGEGAGAGTGVLVFHDGTAWRACDTGQTVSD